MKLQELIPIAFVAAVAAVALALDEPAPERAAPLEPRSSLPPAKWIPVGETLSPNEALVGSDEVAAATEPAVVPTSEAAPVVAEDKASGASKQEPVVTAPKRATPVRKAHIPRSRIQVEARRPPGTERRIQVAAMNAIARTPNLSGRIGVEAQGSVVRLSGWTMTASQSWRAERAVARVSGVRSVINEIRPRIGPITS